MGSKPTPVQCRETFPYHKMSLESCCSTCRETGGQFDMSSLSPTVDKVPTPFVPHSSSMSIAPLSMDNEQYLFTPVPCLIRNLSLPLHNLLQSIPHSGVPVYFTEQAPVQQNWGRVLFCSTYMECGNTSLHV